jgi:MraZ protein
MALFTSTYLNKFDKKGRVSIPAMWRPALARTAFNGIVVFPSYRAAAIEGCGHDYLERLNELLQTPGTMTEAQRSNMEIIISKMQPLPFDTEGRVVLPKELGDFAGIQSDALFVGLGPIFEIWEPSGHKRHYSASEEQARVDRPGLRDIGFLGARK